MKYNMKTMGEYANHLKALIDQLVLVFPSNSPYTSVKNNGTFMNITEDHFYSKGNPDMLDQVDVVLEQPMDYDVEPMVLLNLLRALIVEKTSLSMKMSTAKAGMYISVNEVDYTIDSAVEMATLLRKILSGRVMAGLKQLNNKTEQVTGRDFMKNVEGNQVPYQYPITRKTTLKYDKVEMSNYDATERRLADNLSREIDECMSRCVIVFEPSFDIYDDLTVTIEKYRNKEIV